MSGRGGLATGSEAWLRRYARQVVMPGFREEGQARLGASTVRVAGVGAAAHACALHLVAAGVGRVAAVEGGNAPDEPDRGRPDVLVAVGAESGMPLAAARAAGVPCVVVEGLGGDVLVREGRAGDVAPRALASDDALALAAGALAADLAMRIRLGRPHAGPGIRIGADGGVSTAR